MNDAKDNQTSAACEHEDQPQALNKLLRLINTARKHVTLYRADHVITLGTFKELNKSLKGFLDDRNQVTLVFTRKAVFVNERCYAPSADSEDIFHRLGFRGVMAITFIGEPPSKQVAEFLAFLDAEPREIRECGGPIAYLREHAVTRIAATQSIHTAASFHEEGEDPEQAARDSDDRDRAVAAAVSWLAGQHPDDGESPGLPVTDILSDPDRVAKLITEAVTELHVSQGRQASGEMTSEVIAGLKDLSAADRESWDKAAPQIRKSIAKLPKEMQPDVGPFAPQHESPDRKTAAPTGASVEVAEVEAMVVNALENAPEPTTGAEIESLPDIERLMGAKPTGLLSSWRVSLQPGSVIRSSGRTLETLMIWADSAAEHGRMCQALASLISSAVDISDKPAALTFAGSLAREVLRGDDLSARSCNAKSSLESVGAPTLGVLVQEALELDDYQLREAAALLVEALPDLALSLAHLLGASGDEPFNESLKRGIIRLGRAALARLEPLLHQGAASTRAAAMEILIRVSGASGIEKAADLLEQADAEFAIKGLRVLTEVKLPAAVGARVKLLSHPSVDVRCAAISALGEQGCESSLPHLVRIATRRVSIRDDTPEKIAAIEALARIGGLEATECLEAIGRRRPLFHRGRYNPVRSAAQRALAKTKDLERSTFSKAA